MLKWIQILLLAFLSPPATASPAASERVESMLEALGGREIWASARTLYLTERARHAVYGDGIVATHWRNLEAPGERMRWDGDHIDFEMAWTSQQGWVRRGGDLRDLKPAELNTRRLAWPGDLFVLLHRLATNDKTLTIALDGSSIIVTDPAGTRIARLQLTNRDEISVWEKAAEHPAMFLFGPYRRFGEVRFPDWSAISNGEWAAYHVQLRLSQQAFLKNVSVKRPCLGWQGGALHGAGCDETP